MIITDKAQIKIAELRESNNLRLSGSDELECYELIESDLKLPADATFTRSSVAYLSDGTPVPANVPRFEPGVFGKAIMVEVGTTNLFTNSRLLNNGSGWIPNSATAWVDSSGEYPYIHCETQWDGVYQALSLSDTTYTLTYLVKHKAGSNTIGSHFDGSPSRKIRVDRGAWVDSDIITVPSDGNWHLVEIQATYTTAGSYGVYLQPGRGVTEVSEFYFKYAQIEQKPYATSFIDGTRSAETLTIPTAGVLNPQEGTIEFRIYPLELHDWNDYLGGTGGYPGGRWLLFVGASGQLAWSWSPGPEISTSSGVIVARTWYYVVLRWGQGVKSIWVNGVKKAEGSHDGSYGFPNPFGFGVYNNHDVNSLIDDFRISSCARTDSEILAAYQSGKPLPADEWTTYKLDFDDKVRITAQGQIICNEFIEI